jgi:hypothetical protein
MRLETHQFDVTPTQFPGRERLQIAGACPVIPINAEHFVARNHDPLLYARAASRPTRDAALSRGSRTTVAHAERRFEFADRRDRRNGDLCRVRTFGHSAVGEYVT